MGIYGALSTAVTGLRAQSFALENISGNIANSQTTGFKRIDTDFLDLIPDAPQKRQTAGSVLAQSRATNNVAGRRQDACRPRPTWRSTATASSWSSRRSASRTATRVFAGANYYTRRGDFEVDKGGYLVNGSGYYLKGLPIDPATRQHLGLGAAGAPALQRVPAGAADDPHQLPAQPAAVAQDRALQGVARRRAASCSSRSDFMTIRRRRHRDRDRRRVRPDAAPTTPIAMPPANTLDHHRRRHAGDVQLHAARGGTMPAPTIDIDATTRRPTRSTKCWLRSQDRPAQRSAHGGGRPSRSIGGDSLIDHRQHDATIARSPSGIDRHLRPRSASPTATQLACRGRPSPPSRPTTDAEFIAQSISGGAITVYAAERRAGQRADALGQDRQRRRRAAPSAGTCSTSSNSAATGASTDVDQCRQRLHLRRRRLARSRRSCRPTLTNLTVNGVAVGDVALQHGANGLTQFADANGTAERDDAQPERLSAPASSSRWPSTTTAASWSSYSNGQQHRNGPGGDGQVQRRQPAQAPRRRRVRGDLGIGRADPRYCRAASSAPRSKPPTPTSRRSSPS